MEQTRVDKWLWAARLFKTRSAATHAVLGGRVHVNGARVKPSKEIRSGDTIEVTVRSLKRTVEVAGVADKRGPAAVAAALYVEAPESISAREEAAFERRLARPPARRSRSAANEARPPAAGSNAPRPPARALALALGSIPLASCGGDRNSGRETTT
jgi:ribosome-associated heat shock protein Hsp15